MVKGRPLLPLDAFDLCIRMATVAILPTAATGGYFGFFRPACTTLRSKYTLLKHNVFTFNFSNVAPGHLQGFINDNCLFSMESFFSLYITADMLSLAQLKWKTDPLKMAFLFSFVQLDPTGLI